MDDKKKLNQSEVDAVAGGSDAPGGKNPGKRCRHYECKYCGAGVVSEMYLGHLCMDITVNHLKMCPVKRDLQKYCVAMSNCDNCEYDLGGSDCAIPDD